jgi:uncharacterized delta-60 repeat protein
VARYDGIRNGSEGASAIAVDSIGNVYVTGYGMGIGTDADYVTVKYNSSGDTLWLRKYNAFGNSFDIATSLSVDDFGNVYVTGWSRVSGANYDYLTIKYNSFGDTIWVRRYDGQGDSADWVSDLAVDGSGNVYVTGYSRNGTDYDYATIKYNSMGDTMWIRRYDGSGNDDDYAYGLDVDDSGNVYVTGWSVGSGTSVDYATIKYSSIGDALWERRYNGPSNSWDAAYDIALDEFNNVYVAGVSEEDFTIIKYNSNGDSLWVGRYDGFIDYRPIFLEVDISGNTYVTGTGWIGSNYDYITVKFDSTGDTLWGRSYNGIADSTDEPHALDVDDSGNVFVTGRSFKNVFESDYVTIKYDANGDTHWVRSYDNGSANSIAVDGSGNVYVTGRSSDRMTGSDYTTIKYESSGDTLWVRSYNGRMSSNDGAADVALDGFDNVYVAGSSYGKGTGLDYLTIKYSNMGDTLWVRRYDGQLNGHDEASALAIDISGNVYVTGWSYGTGSGSDYATVKYNSLGDTQWVRRYNGPGNYRDEAYAIALDDSGNVYVTGKSVRSGTDWDYATIKYNSSGDSLWVRRYNHGILNNTAFALAADDSGNVYVTGWSHGSGTDTDYATIKYDKDGNTIWERRYNGLGNGGDMAYAIDVDNSGNVYVTGYSRNGTDSDYATIKYNSIGDTLWVRRYDGPGISSDLARALVVDNSGNVYVTGESSNGTNMDYTTIKYNSNGDTLWVRRYNGSGNSSDDARTITLDGSGNVYVSGRSVGNGTGWDYATIKYSSDGDSLWVMRYNGSGNQEDQVSGLAVDDFGNVYVTGVSYGSGTFDDFVTIKYSQTVGIEEGNDKFKMKKLKYRLYQNLPNPFSKLTAISYQLKAPGHTTLKIYDISGRLVENLVDKPQKSGVYQIEWDGRKRASGIYFYRIQVNEFTATKKLILFH